MWGRRWKSAESRLRIRTLILESLDEFVFGIRAADDLQQPLFLFLKSLLGSL